MNEIRLIVDSSSNETEQTNRNLKVVPLKINLAGKDFVDDNKIDLPSFLEELSQTTEAGKTACPSLQDWLDALEGAEKAIIVTMTSGLSGTYASAMQARDIYCEQNPTSKVIVVDSRSAGPELSIILERIEELLQEELRFVDLEERIAQIRTKTHLLFILQSLHNLAVSGRVSPAIVKLASLLHINVIGQASKEGTLEQLAKARGSKKAVKELVKQMKLEGYHGGRVIIDHCENKVDSERIRDLLIEEFPFAQILIRKTRGLCSFYAEQGGIMVGFES